MYRIMISEFWLTKEQGRRFCLQMIKPLLTRDRFDLFDTAHE